MRGFLSPSGLGWQGSGSQMPWRVPAFWLNGRSRARRDSGQTSSSGRPDERGRRWINGSLVRYSGGYRCPPAAGPLATVLLTGFLWIRMWTTCAKRHQGCARAVEMLGIPLSGLAHKGPLTGGIRPALFGCKGIGNYPHAMPRKSVNMPNIDRVLIRL
jgi:hypothetical protein